ncbi:transposase [Chitinophaga sp. S165]|uniref:transposase n=1 Tax=Chitinophaga sp. S165 TaxID=2135462 RepID=UPI0018EEC0A3
MNFFDNRSTNAAAESFNAKIKAFKNALRGVRDVEFFRYRLIKILLRFLIPQVFKDHVEFLRDLYVQHRFQNIQTRQISITVTPRIAVSNRTVLTIRNFPDNSLARIVNPSEVFE